MNVIMLETHNENRVIVLQCRTWLKNLAFPQRLLESLESATPWSSHSHTHSHTRTHPPVAVG